MHIDRRHGLRADGAKLVRDWPARLPRALPEPHLDASRRPVALSRPAPPEDQRSASKHGSAHATWSERYVDACQRTSRGAVRKSRFRLCTGVARGIARGDAVRIAASHEHAGACQAEQPLKHALP